VEGNSELQIASRGSTGTHDLLIGAVTGDCEGVPLDIGAGKYIQGVLRTTSAKTVIFAKGTFQSIEGSVTLSGDLSVMDAADLGTVTGNSLYSGDFRQQHKARPESRFRRDLSRGLRS
jgi:hypothetical protein